MLSKEATLAYTYENNMGRVVEFVCVMLKRGMDVSSSIEEILMMAKMSISDVLPLRRYFGPSSSQMDTDGFNSVWARECFEESVSERVQMALALNPGKNIGMDIDISHLVESLVGVLW